MEQPREHPVQTLGADERNHARARNLKVRAKHNRALTLADSKQRRFASDADHSEKGTALSGRAESLSDRVRARPGSPGEIFADDRDVRAAGDVRRREVSATNERKTNGSEKARSR